MLLMARLTSAAGSPVASAKRETRKGWPREPAAPTLACVILWAWVVRHERLPLLPLFPSLLRAAPSLSLAEEQFDPFIGSDRRSCSLRRLRDAVLDALLACHCLPVCRKVKHVSLPFTTLLRCRLTVAQKTKELW
jgi:hypothetical protein